MKNSFLLMAISQTFKLNKILWITLTCLLKQGVYVVSVMLRNFNGISNHYMFIMV